MNSTKNTYTKNMTATPRLELGREVKVMVGDWQGVIGYVSMIRGIDGTRKFRVNNKHGFKSPVFYAAHEIEVIINS